ncbi:hypothetical protein D3C87_2001540 [compost metagenome]
MRPRSWSMVSTVGAAVEATWGGVVQATERVVASSPSARGLRRRESMAREVLSKVFANESQVLLK